MVGEFVEGHEFGFDLSSKFIVFCDHPKYVQFMYVVESYSILLAIILAKKKLTRQGMPLFFLRHNFVLKNMVKSM
jgi:hypothetical protein